MERVREDKKRKKSNKLCNQTASLPRGHAVDFLAQRPPVVRLQLRILDSLLAPVLMQMADMVLAGLEIDELVPDAFLDEHPERMLLHDRFLILQYRTWS